MIGTQKKSGFFLDGRSSYMNGGFFVGQGVFCLDVKFFTPRIFFRSRIRNFRSRIFFPSLFFLTPRNPKDFFSLDAYPKEPQSFTKNAIYIIYYRTVSLLFALFQPISPFFVQKFSHFF